MKIFDQHENVIKGSFQFEHASAEISITTTTRFPEVAVFFKNGRNAGPFRTVADAMRHAEAAELMHMLMTEEA